MLDPVRSSGAQSGSVLRARPTAVFPPHPRLRHLPHRLLRCLPAGGAPHRVQEDPPGPLVMLAEDLTD